MHSGRGMRQALMLLILLLPPGTASALEFWPTPYRLEAVWHEELLSDYATIRAYTPEPGEDEYLLVGGKNTGRWFSQHKSHYTIYDRRHKALDQLNLPATVTYATEADVDRDGVSELLVSFLGDTVAGVRAYDWPELNVLWEFLLREPDYRWREVNHWDIIVRPQMMIDTPFAATPSLLIGISEGYARMPSGYVLADARTGKEIWHRWLASGMLDVEPGAHLLDADGDGEPEIIGGSSASCNGASLDGLRDDHSYVYSLDMRGNVRWLYVLPMKFSVCYPMPVESAGGTKLIVLQAINGDGGADSLLLLEAGSGEVLKKVELPREGTQRGIDRWNPGPDGEERWILTGLGSRPLTCDAELQIAVLSERIAARMYPSDLNGDGLLEIMGPGADGRLEVRNADFELMARLPEPRLNCVAVRSPGTEWASIYAVHDEMVYGYRLQPVPYYGLQLGGRIAGGGLLLFLLGYGPLWAVRARTAYVKTRREREQTQAWAAIASKLAHDIRTPVSVLRLSGENLEMELEAALGDVPVHLRQYFDTFRAETERTENVARGLLKFTRLAPPTLEKLDLGKLVRETVERCPHSPDIEVVHEIEPDLPTATVDHPQMVALLENLMSNSLKAMKGRGRLTVRLGKARELRKKAEVRDVFVLEVTDTGRGIPAQDLPRIFEPYFSHSEGGTGLGLVIVHKIVEDHHGTVQAQSSVGNGTTFTIRIPVQPEVHDE